MKPIIKCKYKTQQKNLLSVQFKVFLPNLDRLRHRTVSYPTVFNRKPFKNLKKR